MTFILLWSFAVFLASVLAAVLSGLALKPRLKPGKMLGFWLMVGAVGYAAAVISYSISLTNDIVGILGLTVLICAATVFSYEGEPSEKLFVAMMSALIANVCTFMFCGTTDTFLGAALGFFASGTPYNTQNILLFIGIKLVVYTIILLLYRRFLLKKVRDILALTHGHMQHYLIAPMVSIAGFYVINLLSNRLGIMPTSQWFLPLYLTICLIFVFEYIQIFTSVKWTAQAMQNQVEKERIGAELNIAKQIQADMLPQIFPPFPARTDFDVYATMEPAKEVGGDFYDFFLVDDDHLAMVMADVSGKGVPAALFMVIAKTLIKTRTLMGGTPAQILGEVNNQLCEGNEAQLFVTVWLAILDLRTGKGVAANAGHEHPVIRRGDGEFELVKYRHSPALATMEDVRFREHDFELAPGDTLFVYTDGVPEATDENDTLYGDERMLACLNRNKNQPLNAILSSLRNDIRAFVGKAPQFDDITMLGLNYYGGGSNE